MCVLFKLFIKTCYFNILGLKIAQKRKEKVKTATVPIRGRKYNSKEMNEKSRGHNNDDYGKKIIKRPVVETKKDKRPKKKDKDDDSSSDDGDSDWEEVEGRNSRNIEIH